MGLLPYGYRAVTDSDGELKIMKLETGEKFDLSEEANLDKYYSTPEEMHTATEQISALSDTNDFYEECLVEMAEIVYADDSTAESTESTESTETTT